MPVEVVFVEAAAARSAAAGLAPADGDVRSADSTAIKI
jgi:hypothetical protein